MAQPRQDESLTRTIRGIYTSGNHLQQQIPLARATRDTDKDFAREMTYEGCTGGYPSMLLELALLQNQIGRAHV